MRVLFQLLDSGIGGGQLVAARVAGALAARGHGLGLVVPGPGPAADRFAALGAELHELPLDNLRRPAGAVSAARLLRRYDLLYTHTSIPGAILAGAAARLAGRPLVVHQHAAPYFSSRPVVAAAQRRLLCRALASATVVAVAEHIGAALVEAGVGRDRIAVLANGVPLPSAAARPLHPGAALAIGTLARLDPGKNVHVFVEAARLAGALLPESVPASFVAGVTSGAYPAYASAVRAAAATAGVELVFPGDDGVAFLGDLDIVVLPTAAEGSPLTLLEAMALGRAVVASDIPGIREVVVDGVSGLLAPPGDAAALAAAIATLVADPARRAALGAAARARVEERYLLGAMLERACTILEAAARVAERRIPVSAPDLSGNEAAYVQECLTSTWISSKGDFLERFEQRFAEFCGARHAVACNNGTSALHLALLALGIGPGDEVIVPTLTYIASANAVRYCSATPRFVDVLPGTWNIDPADVARKIGSRTKAIMPVHLFGVPAALDPLRALAAEHGLAIVEDAAEAHGARYQGQVVGPLGDVGTFSFYGNKIITTGEGGIVVTNDPALRDLISLYKGQGQDPARSYRFPVVGFNYRMTNVQAAIGLAQLESVEAKLAARARVAARYRSQLGGRLTLQATSPGDVGANWMVVALLAAGGEAERDSVAAALASDGIETRPVFYPVHAEPPYLPGETDPGGYPVAVDVAARGLCLPTWGGLADGDVDFVCDRLLAAVERVTA